MKSLSGEDFVQYGNEDAYWVFTAVCSDDSERKIQRKTDGTDWCGTDLTDFCDADKKAAAELICGSRYSEGLALQREASRAEQARQQAEQERRTQAAAAASNAERIAIEEELISIEQEQIQLRRQELELQRRANKIEATLNDLGISRQ